MGRAGQDWRSSVSDETPLAGTELIFMTTAAYDGAAPKRAKRWKTARSLGRSFSASRVLLALLIALVPHASKEQVAVSRPIGESQASPPEPALPAILKIFDTFEVVGMPAAHGQKDVDDFILSLIRDPRFSGSVNDIVVECGNVRYEPILDRYIVGENVSFTEVNMSGGTRLSPCVANPAFSSNCTRSSVQSINTFPPQNDCKS